MKRKAFTLIELLVVIAVIAVLMAILMPALRKVREQARQRSCGTRIRQQILSLIMYADDNNSKLPLPKTRGNWLQDVAVNVVNNMLRTGMTREMFYCPTNHNQQVENDAFFMFTNTSWDGFRFTNETGFIVSGYIFILQSEDNGRPAINRYTKDSIKPEWLKTTRDSYAAMREVVVDSIFGNRASNTLYGFDFAKVQGGIFAGGSASGKGRGLYDQSSHLKNDFEPYGGNLGYLDGHVDWQKFDPEMSSTGVAIPRYDPSPSFFW